MITVQVSTIAALGVLAKVGAAGLFLLSRRRGKRAAEEQLSLEQRSSPLCSGRHRGASLLSSQNAALVSFRIPSPGQGFKLRVSFHPNPRRNVIFCEKLEILTLRCCQLVTS